MHKNVYKEKNINATRFLKRCQKEKVEMGKKRGSRNLQRKKQA
jgi:hypothetical protein